MVLAMCRFSILACTAKTTSGSAPDIRLKEGIRWLLAAIDSVFDTLDVKVGMGEGSTGQGGYQVSLF